MKIPNLLLFVLVCFVASFSGAADKPSFIVINIDDMGYADIEPFGSKLNRTPNLSRMASEGCKLTSFYAAPVCSPSRAALMTGCYPKRALPIPHVLFPANDVGLHPNEITIAELLRAAGYTTGIIGKWHLGDQPEFLPLQQGFDSFYGLPYSNDMGPAADGVKSNLGAPIPQNNNANQQPPLVLMRDNRVLQRVLAEDQTKLVANYTHESIEFIRTHKKKPFFLYLPHSAVHFPLYPGKEFQGKSKNGLIGDWIEEVDWSVGRVLDTLRELKLDSNTFVLFTTDNGGTPRSVNTPLRGNKGSTWEGGMRVPTIAWWPGKVPAGKTVDAIAGMFDVLPTLVGLGGGHLPTDRKLDGGDLWPILSGRSNAKSPHDSFFFYKGLKLEAVRVGKWKLHLQQNMLVDLEQDIGESNNVADKNADIVANLKSVADSMRDDLGLDVIGPGCRTLGTVVQGKPIMSEDGTIRAEFR
ncbi:MAG: sulfatase [Pirellula sp.]